MVRRLLRLVLLPLLLPVATASALAPGGETDFSPERFRSHVAFLADDRLEGRDSGSSGHALAAAYVADQFSRLGLRPGGTNGWYQQVPLRSARLIGEPSMTVLAGGRKQSWRGGTDIILGPSQFERKQDFTAPVTFVGYGIDAPDKGLRDYDGLDVRGKIVAVLSGAPGDLDSEVAAFLSERKQAMAARRGAIGMITLPTEASEATAPWELRLRRRRVISMAWAEGKRAAGDAESVRAVVMVNTPVAEKLFAGAARSYRDVRAEAGRKGRRVSGFPLQAQARIQRRSSWKPLASPNVIGLLPGADPRLRNEYIVLMAHLDHLGIDRSAGKDADRIYNGALDNAAGIATMIEAARAFAQSGRRPRRSILFIASTAEEKGLLGADYFARHPIVPIDQIAAAVDLDMPLLLYDFADVIAFGAEHSTVARAVERAARSMNVAVSPDPMPEEHIFVRSDHYMFVKQGVPAILLMTGFANGGEAQWRDFLAKTYHSVSDDMRQPIRWDAGARFAKLNYLIARELADATERPRWYRGDMFGDLYAPGAPRAPIK